jgi:hypothetical protein
MKALGLAVSDRIARLAVVIGTLAPSNCSSSTCPGGAPAPLVVTVQDAISGQYICNAEVTATSGGSTYQATSSGSLAALADASCIYILYPTTSGMYTVVVSAPTFEAAPGRTLSLQFDACGHVATTQFLAISLSP